MLYLPFASITNPFFFPNLMLKISSKSRGYQEAERQKASDVWPIAKSWEDFCFVTMRQLIYIYIYITKRLFVTLFPSSLELFIFLLEDVINTYLPTYHYSLDP